MKIVLLFYLNSLRLVLVQTQTRQPYVSSFNADVGCKFTKAGREYTGPLNVTRSGLTCQRWTLGQPHSHRHKNSTFFPEGSASEAGNKCRNPDSNYKEGVWCYTTDPNIRWEQCDVDFCDCKMTMAGEKYAGPLNVTRSGLTCQRWNSNKPHSHRHKNSTFFPEGSAEAAGNKCRNPDMEYIKGVWCYTSDPNRRWEECDVDYCNCKMTKAGHEYAGPLNVTRSGLTCQPWNSNQPHSHRHKNSTQFPEGSASAAGNKCRNPDSDYNEEVWCYTTDSNRRWEQCDVPFCDLTSSIFQGQDSETSSQTSPTRIDLPHDSASSIRTSILQDTFKLTSYSFLLVFLYVYNFFYAQL